MNGAGNPDSLHGAAEAGEFTAAVVPSKLLRVGFGGLIFGTYNLFYWSLVEGFRTRWDVRASLFISLAVLTVAWTVGIGLTARGRKGRRNRVEGYLILGAATVILWAPLIVEWLTGFRIGFGRILRVGLVLGAGGLVLLFDGSRAYRHEMKERFGVNYLYRKGWLGIPLRAVAAVWVAAGFADGALYLTNDAADLFFDVVTFGALVIGAIGAVLIVAAPRRKAVYVDRQGHVVESLSSVTAASDG